MKQDYSHIVLVLDKSGSMGHLADDTIGGVNAFLDEQKRLPGIATYTEIQFDTTYNFRCNVVPLPEVQPLSRTTYSPGGMTALLDATARGIIETGKRLADMPEAERPARILFVLLTDGHENSSVETTKEAVKRLIEQQRDVYQWDFLFLGANIDSFAEAGAIGVHVAQAANYTPTTDGIRAALSVASHNVARARAAASIGLSARAAPMAYTAAERERLKRAGVKR